MIIELNYFFCIINCNFQESSSGTGNNRDVHYSNESASLRFAQPHFMYQIIPKTSMSSSFYFNRFFFVKKRKKLLMNDLFMM